jgi:hypothetical protein
METTANISEGIRSPRRTAGSATYLRCELNKVRLKPSEAGDPRCETVWLDPQTGDLIYDLHEIDGRWERDLGMWVSYYTTTSAVTLTVLEDLVGSSADLIVHTAGTGQQWVEWTLPPGTLFPR